MIRRSPIGSQIAFRPMGSAQHRLVNLHSTQVFSNRNSSDTPSSSNCPHLLRDLSIVVTRCTSSPSSVNDLEINGCRDEALDLRAGVLGYWPGNVFHTEHPAGSPLKRNEARCQISQNKTRLHYGDDQYCAPTLGDAGEEWNFTRLLWFQWSDQSTRSGH